MDDEKKSREELLNELIDLRRQIEICNRDTRTQKEFFENLVQNSVVPTFALDSSHRVIIWNRACEELTGIKAADIVGTDEQWKPFYRQKQPVLADLIIDAKIGKLPLLYSAYAKSQFIPEGYQAEGWYPSIRGVQRYISFHAAPIRNSEGKLIAAVESFEDLTEIKKTEERLMESEKRYRVLFEDSPAAMLVIDPEPAEVVGANEAAFTYYGYSREELIGKSMTDIIALLPDEQIFQMLREAMLGPQFIQLKHRLKSGEIRDVEISRGPIRMNGKSYLFSIIHDVTTRKMAEEAAREGESKLTAITSLAGDAIILIDEWGNVCFWNSTAEKMFGYDRTEMIGRNVETIMPVRFREAHRKAFEKFVETGQGAMIGKVYEVAGLRKDGSELPIELSISGLLLKGKWHSAGVIRDITGRRNLEMQLRQAQKMEAMGTFAGGIAHDFNNMLTVIIGHASLLTMKMAKDDPLVADVRQILAFANRATSLTNSLLAFSRKTPLETRPANLNDIIGEIEQLLVRLLREDIEFRTTLSEENMTVMADPMQIEQVMMNLATNARDAMPQGGIFSIGTEVVELDREFIRVHGHGTPGRYASLTCSDDGVGMDKETAQRIFEPFFTTKEIGRGTGLGLAIVYGIVQQHNGFINCYSEPGKGTTFRIFLPLVRPVPVEEAHEPEPTPKGGIETILLAEDDTAARDLTRQVLETFGYTVIEAMDGEDAVSQFIANRDQIDLVILDVIMPNKNGKEVWLDIRELRPDIKCLFTSCHAANIFNESEKEGLLFTPKPIVPTSLLQKVRKILDGD
jgi:two-component system NtrC family sensor kinase